MQLRTTGTTTSPWVSSPGAKRGAKRLKRHPMLRSLIDPRLQSRGKGPKKLGRNEQSSNHNTMYNRHITAKQDTLEDGSSNLTLYFFSCQHSVNILSFSLSHYLQLYLYSRCCLHIQVPHYRHAISLMPQPKQDTL